MLSFKNIARVISALVMILISFYAARAEPSLSFDKGIDKTAMKGLVHEIPASYFDGITAVYFSKTPYRYDRGTATVGMFYRNSITLYNVKSYSLSFVKKVLLHELGHNHWVKLSQEEQQTYCSGEVTDSCEEQFADEFAETHGNVQAAA